MDDNCSCVGVLELTYEGICKKCGKVKVIPETQEKPLDKKVIDVDYGVASVYDSDNGQIIEINRKLTGELREKVIRHEKMHRSGAYSREDMKVDFQADKPHFFESLKFAFLNPESLVGYFPIMYSYYFKKWTYNPTATLPFVYLGVIFSLFFLILFRINFFLAFLGWSCIVVIFNIILLFITHRYVKKIGGY